jgi:hypothetical protein
MHSNVRKNALRGLQTAENGSLLANKEKEEMRFGMAQKRSA